MAETLEVPEGWETIVENTLIKKIEKPGEGIKRPSIGAKVQVHYTGRLVKNGEKFDSSRDRGEPFSFTVGKGEVIKGWDQGIPTMLKGERATFRMSSEFGYGASGSPPKIPGGACLEFDVELLSWSSKEDITGGKKGIFKKILQKGTGFDKPNECAEVAVAFVGTVKGGDAFDQATVEEPFRFTIGEAENVCPGFEKAIKSMTKSERARFTINPGWGFSDKEAEAKGIPPNSTLIYTIELLELKREKETWDMKKEEKIEFAKTKKDQGNGFFKQSKWEIAAKRYESSIKALESDYDFTDEMKQEAKELKLLCNLNLAATKIKQKKYNEAVSACDKALAIDASNVKALFRKGAALSAKDDWIPAQANLEKALSLDPENKDIKREIALMHKRIKLQNQKDKAMYQRMFS